MFDMKGQFVEDKFCSDSSISGLLKSRTRSSPAPSSNYIAIFPFASRLLGSRRGGVAFSSARSAHKHARPQAHRGALADVPSPRTGRYNSEGFAAALEGRAKSRRACANRAHQALSNGAVSSSPVDVHLELRDGRELSLRYEPM
jgi:hypothetical protein